MQKTTAELAADIFFDVEHKIHNRKDLLAKRINAAEIPEKDKQAILQAVKYDLNLRKRLTVDLRRRAEWRILAECLDLIEPAAKALVPEAEISIGVLGFNLFVTEKGLGIINDDHSFEPGDDCAGAPSFFEADLLGTAIHSQTAYPCTVFGVDRVRQPRVEEQLLSAVLGEGRALSATERHENMHHLFQLVLDLQGKSGRPFAKIHQRRHRIDILGGLDATDFIMRNEKRILLEAIRVMSPELHSLDDLTAGDWQDLDAKYYHEALESVYTDTADELLARLYARQDRCVICTIRQGYVPGWTRDLPDFDISAYESTLRDALLAFNALCGSGVPRNTCIMMLIDHDLRNWPSAVREGLQP